MEEVDPTDVTAVILSEAKDLDSSRCALRMTSKVLRPWFVRCLAMTSLFLLFFVASAFSEEIPERIDGRVISVDEPSRTLIVDFEHPATEEHTELKFQVAEDAGFKDFKRLSQLNAGDLVSVDYLKAGKVLKAIYIIHIPENKTYFTHKEIADALVRIKSNQKNPNIHEKG